MTRRNWLNIVLVLFDIVFLVGGVQQYLEKANKIFGLIKIGVYESIIIFLSVTAVLFIYNKEWTEKHLDELTGRTKRKEARKKHDAYCERVEAALEAVKMVYEIMLKDPNNYQLLFTPKLKAWEKVRSLYYELIMKEKEKKGIYPIFPQEIDINSQDSMGAWYLFLVDEKARIEMERN